MEPVFCFFNTTPTWGGGEKWHFEFSQFLLNKGYKVLFFLSPGSVLEEKTASFKNYKIFKLKVNQFSFLNTGKIIKVSRILKKECVSHILINSSEDLKTAGVSAQRAGIPNIIYRRGSAVPIRNSPLNRFLFGKIITNIIANSKGTKQTILAKNSNLFPAEKIEVIYNGLETAVSMPIKPIYENKSNCVVLGNAGRFTYQKNQKFLLELAKRLKQEDIDFKLLIAGKGKLEKELRDFIDEYELSDKVDIVGFIEDIHTFMASIDVFLMSSRWEGFGYVTAEALLNRKPVVAYNVDSNPEIVMHEKSGFIVPAFEEDAFLERTKQLIASAQMRKEMGEFGNRFVKENFDRLNQFKKTEEYLLSL